MKYRAEIDGLRSIAVVPVILFHAGFTPFSGGFVGVDVFFVISGYLITSLIIQDIESNRFSIANFYERRVRRIIPALYMTVFLTTIFSYLVFFPQQLISLAKSAASIPLFASNIFFWSERGYFADASQLKPLIHTWSLAVEEQFYIIYPLVLAIGYKKHFKLLKFFLIIVFIVSLAASFYVTKVHFETAFFLPFTRAWELLLGCFIVFMRISGSSQKWNLFVFDLLSLFGLLLIFYAYINFDKDTLYPFINALIPTLGTALVIVGTQKNGYVRVFLANRIFVYIGLISYSLYLIHWPIFAYARNLGIFDGYEYVYIAISLILAFVSYHFLEKPFRNRELVSRKLIYLVSSIGAGCIFILSFYQVFNEGFPNRYRELDKRILVQMANYPGYNQKLFDSLEFTRFKNDNKKHVLLIGDSHAKDFLNILNESRALDFISISTRQVNSECGNLYLSSYDEIEKFIRKSRIERCRVLGRYEGVKFRQIIDSADEIWLVALWSPWVVNYLPTSLDNLVRDFDKPVRVFGNKNFGVISESLALAINPEERVRYVHKVSENALDVNRLMDKLLAKYPNYYSVLDSMCGGDSSACRIFDNNGNLISPDGGHITKEGAIEIGKRMRVILKKIIH